MRRIAIGESFVLKDEKTRERGESVAIPVASQLCETVRAGLPLESGLRALAEQTRSRQTREALLELSERLERGTPLKEALRNTDADLPHSMGALVEAGIESGRLDCLMQYSVDQTRNLMSLRQQIWLFLSYPLFLMWVAGVICGATMLLIPSKFKGIFDDFGMMLPYLTETLVTISVAMNSIGAPFWIVLAIAVAVTMLGVQFFGASNSGRRWATSIPMIGRVFQYAALADLCRLLAILAESGLPLPKALRYSGAASEDQWLMRKCQIVAHDIEDGTAPSTAAAMANLPNSLAQVFRNVNSKQVFVEALRGLADIYSARCFNSSQLVNSVVGPIAVTVVIGLIAVMVIALFLPLVKLLNDLA